MDIKERMVQRGRVLSVICALLAGTALFAGGIISTEGIKIETYEEKEKRGYCTVLIYMDGSDLESDYGAAAMDLKEMERAVNKADPEGENIHIVVEAGGAKVWKYEHMEPYEYGRFCITGKGVSKVEAMEARDMGRSDTLADFINYGTQSYPAEHYGLIFWNHGSGQIQGFGSDENFEESALGLKEIKDGFEKSSYEDTFDFIGMDACLMSNIELIAVLQEKTEYFIASEDLELEEGYDYKWMEMLIETDLDKEYGESVGNAILSSYKEFYQEQPFPYTMTVIDMEEYEAFSNALEEIMDTIWLQMANEEDAVYRKLGSLRSKIQGFGETYFDEMAEQVDILDLFSVLLEEAFYPEEMYQNLNTAYEQMVSGKVWSGYAKEPSGINIYLPSGSNEWLSTDFRIYREIPFHNKYQKFTEEYAAYLMQGSERIWNVPIQEETEIVMEIPSEEIFEIADAYSTVFMHQNVYNYMIFADGDVELDLSGYLKAPIENVFWGLKGEILCLIEDYSIDYMTEYKAPILYKKSGSDWIECMMRIIFSEDAPDGKILAIIPCEVLKQEYFLEEGDEIIPLYPIYNQEDANASGTEYQEKNSKIYNDEYYMGNVVVMEKMEMGDGELEKITVEDSKKLDYGFLIRDSKMELYYTEFAVEYDN